MGTSAREIEREIRATRDRMDGNLARLEAGAASNVKRYGRVVIVGLGSLAVAAIGLLIYRRARRPRAWPRTE